MKVDPAALNPPTLFKAECPLIFLNGSDTALMDLLFHEILNEAQQQNREVIHTTEQAFFDDPHALTQPTLWSTSSLPPLIAIPSITESSGRKFQDYMTAHGDKACLLLTSTKFKAAAPFVKFAQQDQRIAYIATYPLDPPQKKKLIKRLCQVRHITCTPDALETIVHYVPYEGLDALLKKLSLLFEPQTPLEDHHITPLIDGNAQFIEQLGVILALQDRQKWMEWISERTHDTSSLLSALRQATTYFLNLLEVRRALAHKVPLENAMRGLRPPLFFKQIPNFKKAVTTLSPTQIAETLRGLAEAEVWVKKQGGDRTGLSNLLSLKRQG